MRLGIIMWGDITIEDIYGILSDGAIPFWGTMGSLSRLAEQTDGIVVLWDGVCGEKDMVCELCGKLSVETVVLIHQEEKDILRL